MSDRLAAAAKAAQELIHDVESFTLDKDIEEGEKPFNVLDYCRMQDLGVELSAALREHERSKPVRDAERKFIDVYMELMAENDDDLGSGAIAEAYCALLAARQAGKETP